jgi:hypothetical protein
MNEGVRDLEVTAGLKKKYLYLNYNLNLNECVSREDHYVT